MKNSKNISNQLPEEEVAVNLSICKKCNGVVRVTIDHLIPQNFKKEFAKEAYKYDLEVKNISLLEYQSHPAKFCTCK